MKKGLPFFIYCYVLFFRDIIVLDGFGNDGAPIVAAAGGTVVTATTGGGGYGHAGKFSGAGGADGAHDRGLEGRKARVSGGDAQGEGHGYRCIHSVAAFLQDLFSDLRGFRSAGGDDAFLCGAGAAAADHVSLFVKGDKWGHRLPSLQIVVQ